MTGLATCPVCGARLAVERDALGRHRDRRWDEFEATCPASGQTVLEAIGSLQDREPITARGTDR